MSAFTHEHYIYSDFDAKVGKPQTPDNLELTFTNMSARIYGDVASGTLMITLNANEIAGLIPMMRKLDVKIEKAKPTDAIATKAHLEIKPTNNATPDPK